MLDNCFISITSLVVALFPFRESTSAFSQTRAWSKRALAYSALCARCLPGLLAVKFELTVGDCQFELSACAMTAVDITNPLPAALTLLPIAKEAISEPKRFFNFQV